MREGLSITHCLDCLVPSRALRHWQTRSRKVLDEFEAAPVRRGAQQQLVQAYVISLSSHFQLFCRALYSEAADHLINHPAFQPLAPVLLNALNANRKLHTGNANPGNIGADFARFGFRIWDRVNAADRRNPARQKKLIEMNTWRNAIAHQDFDAVGFGGREMVRLGEVRRWRAACSGLAVAFDREMGLYLRSLSGVRPW